MVKNQIGGNKSKNISSRFANKKIATVDPDLENSFFAIISSKPNGMMCNVKICVNDEVYKMLTKKGIPLEVQANIGKLKNDKRNSTLNLGDYVAIEFNYEMKRANGNMYAYILCKYDKIDIKYYKKNKMLPNEDSNDDDMIIEEDGIESDDIKKEETFDENINLDDL